MLIPVVINVIHRQPCQQSSINPMSSSMCIVSSDNDAKRKKKINRFYYRKKKKEEHPKASIFYMYTY